MSVMTWFVAGVSSFGHRKEAIEAAVQHALSRKMRVCPGITVCWNSSDKRWPDYGQTYPALHADEEANDMLRALRA